MCMICQAKFVICGLGLNSEQHNKVYNARFNIFLSNLTAAKGRTYKQTIPYPPSIGSAAIHSIILHGRVEINNCETVCPCQTICFTLIEPLGISRYVMTLKGRWMKTEHTWVVLTLQSCVSSALLYFNKQLIQCVFNIRSVSKVSTDLQWQHR